MPSMDQIAMYAGYAITACTAGHAIVKAARSVAALTPSKADDKALDTLDSVLGAVEAIVGKLSILGKRS